MDTHATSITLRKALPSDVLAWATLRAQLWPETSIGRYCEQLSPLIESDIFQGWLAFDGTQAIGFAEASLRPFANGCDNGPVPFLEGIWIDPAFRKKGISRRLIKEVENWALSHGIAELGSDTELHNRESQVAHVQWGFEETERVVYYRKKLSP